MQEILIKIKIDFQNKKIWRHIVRIHTCNCVFKLKTRLMILLHHYIPRCPYYTTYFAYRRTGVHPPLASFN